MDTVVSVLQLLVAGGIGGLFTQYVGKGPERRAARVEVRKALSEVEQALRHSDGNEESADDRFRERLRTFVISAMVAQVPRRLVDQYCRTVLAGRAAMFAEVREMGLNLRSSPHLLGAEIGDYVNDVRDLLIDYLWRPRQQRPRLNAHLDALEARRKQLTEDDVKSLGHFFGYDYWPV